MLKKLRNKFILTNMMLVGIVMLCIFIVISIYSYTDLRTDLSNSMRIALAPSNEMDFYTPVIGTDKTSSDMAYAAVYAVEYRKDDGSIRVLSREKYMDESVLEIAVNYVVAGMAQNGRIDEYDLVYYKTETANDVRIAFADANYITESMIELVITLFLIAVFAMIVIYFISLYIAKQAIAPIETMWAQQKRFVADASHELKTPLSVILANNSILRIHKDDCVEKQMQWVDSTEDEARHMRSLVEDMLTLTKNEFLNENISFSNVNLTATVNRCLLQFEAVSFEKNILLTSDIEDNIQINGNELQLKQLAMILIDNALKYEPTGGKVFVALNKQPRNVCLTVQNFTATIKNEDLPHIFERFYRGDKSRSAGDEKSFGLGLPIAKSIVDEHSGNISVTSNSDIGTIFKTML